MNKYNLNLFKLLNDNNLLSQYKQNLFNNACEKGELDSNLLFFIIICQFITSILYMNAPLPLIFIVLDIIIGLFYQNFINLTNNINNFIESVIPSYY